MLLLLSSYILSIINNPRLAHCIPQRPFLKTGEYYVLLKNKLLIDHTCANLNIIQWINTLLQCPCIFLFSMFVYMIVCVVLLSIIKAHILVRCYRLIYILPRYPLLLFVIRNTGKLLCSMCSTYGLQIKLWIEIWKKVHCVKMF